MTAHRIEAAHTLADTARAIVAEPVKFHDGAHDRSVRFAAQCYLDNLSDSYDEPDELLELLARGDAAEEYRGKDWLFDDWFDRRGEDYVAERRVFHGMIGGGL